MKTKLCTLIMIAGMTVSLAAQTTTQYNYDVAGNRVKRWLTSSKQLVAPDSSNKSTEFEDIESFILANRNQGHTEELVNNRDSREVKVFPNPFQEKLEIQAGNAFLEGYEIRIYDGSGKLFLSASSNQGNSQIDLSHALAGTYYLALLPKGGKRIYWKLVKG